jgi:PHD/YefM family antitoxin component YafN of YafNO toxin-antitoxin module
VYILRYTLYVLRRICLQSTNPKKLRAELKDYLDLASKEPIRIQRRAGDSFILLKEDQYQKMQQEIFSLQGRLLGMSEIISGKATDYRPGEKKRLKRLARK